jgi:hypothetical protein
MKLNIIRYLKEADESQCPLISLEVACNMTTMEEIRKLPSHYERLSCRKILQFVGDNPSTRILNPDTDEVEKLNVVIYRLIDNGWDLKEIADYLQNA